MLTNKGLLMVYYQPVWVHLCHNGEWITIDDVDRDSWIIVRCTTKDQREHLLSIGFVDTDSSLEPDWDRTRDFIFQRIFSYYRFLRELKIYNASTVEEALENDQKYYDEWWKERFGEERKEVEAAN